MSTASNKTRDHFAANVRAYRIRQGLTQAGLAARLKISQPAVSDIEHSRYSPGLDLICRLAAALETTAANLLTPPVVKRLKKSRKAS